MKSAAASVIDAIEHALDQVGDNRDYAVLLQPTSPLGTVEDSDRAITPCDECGAPSVIGVSLLPKPLHFYGRVDEAGRYNGGGRHLVGTVVVNGAVYVGRPEVLLRDRTFQSEGALAEGMPFERSWDVDTPAEFGVCDVLFPFRVTGGT